jgi:cytochrome c553
LCRVLVVLAAIALGGFLFVSAGLMPIAASEGHWPVTQWFLHYVMRRSVSSSTAGVEAPRLDDPALVLKGAGHYATNCLPCHGAPGRPRPQLVQKMVPQPPYLPDKVDDLSSEGLFWVVKHGIKYTAMPGWVAQERDDEVWAMVAFLQRLPDLDAQQFESLAYGERAGMRDAGTGLVQLQAPPSSALANCARCHGSDGTGRGNGAFPRLVGQRKDYLRASLQSYASGDRHSGIMQPLSAELRPREIERLARHFAAQDAAAPKAEPADTAAIARGRALAFRGDPKRRLPSCVECHGPGDAERNPMYPELAGQYADYLALQLRLFKTGSRGGTGYAPVMREIAGRLEEGDIRDLSVYYASLRER